MKASELDEMLRKHYGGTPSKPNPGYFASEIQAPDSTRRADGLWLPLDSHSRGQIIGHEYKVTRSDVIAELSDPMKSHAWAKFCTRWWLVVASPDLLTGLPPGLDVPEHWGIMLPPQFNSRSNRLMAVVRDAAPLHPEPNGSALATIMTRIYYNGDDQQAQVANLKRQVQDAKDNQRRTLDQLYELREQMRRSGVSTANESEEDKDRREFVEALTAGLRNYDHNMRGALAWQTWHEQRKLTAPDVLSVLSDIAAARTLVSSIRSEAGRKLRDLEDVMSSRALDEVSKALKKMENDK